MVTKTRKEGKSYEEIFDYGNGRKWDDKRQEAFESEMKLRKYVSFIHHTRGGEWESLLPSQQRTLDEADEDYIKIYSDNF